MLSFSAISHVVLRRLFSIIDFILSSSTSVGRPERGAPLRSKSPERKRAKQHHTTFSELALRFYLFGSNKVKCDENDRFY